MKSWYSCLFFGIVALLPVSCGAHPSDTVSGAPGDRQHNIAAGNAGDRENMAMSGKLDPQLAQIAEESAAAEGQFGMAAPETVTVMVALLTAPDAAALQRLAAAGLTVRSAVGDVVTGTIPANRLAAVAAQPDVVAIEGSRPMAPEQGLMTE